MFRKGFPFIVKTTYMDEEGTIRTRTKYFDDKPDKYIPETVLELLELKYGR